MIRWIVYAALVIVCGGCRQGQVQKSLSITDLRPGMPIADIRDYLIPIDQDLSAAGIDGPPATQMREYRAWVRGETLQNATVSGSVQTDMVPMRLTFEVIAAAGGRPEQSRLIKMEVDEAAVAERNRQIEYMEDKTDAWREKQLEEFRRQTDAAQRQGIYLRNQLP